MNWTNFHTHSNYCHGKGFLEEYVKKAISKKMFAIGFSSHAPIPFYTDWHVKQDLLNNYIQEINDLKKKYSQDIKIYSGLEADYIPNIAGPANFYKQNLDIIIGSVHFVGQFENEVNCCMDHTIGEFERGLKNIFNNDIKKMVRIYYDNVISMIKNDPPDIIGHLDLIKKFNSDSKYFNENDKWYQDILTEVIEIISKSNCIVEINTRGYYKGITKEFFPSKNILEKCFKLKIPITISSDAHHPNEIDNGFEKVASIILNIGYKHIHVFNKNKWQKTILKEDGLELEK